MILAIAGAKTMFGIRGAIVAERRRDDSILEFLLSWACPRTKVEVMAKTSVAIYRVGVDKANLLRVRSEDISVYQDPSRSDICVEPQSATKTPGISCFATVHQVRRLAANTFPAHAGQTVWELPAGTDFDDSVLRFWQPHPQRNPDKWFWSPARRMPGSDFITALRLVNAHFR